MTVLLRDAIKPNLLQTLEGGPAFVHCRAVRQHRPRQQLDHRRPARAGDQRHRLHRGRLRGRHGRREVLRHQVPGVGPRARMRPWWSPRSGRSRCTAASARSWPASRSTRRSSRRTSTRSGSAPQNLAKQIENVHDVRRPGGRRDQLVPDRHAGRGRGDPRGRAGGRRPRRGRRDPLRRRRRRARRTSPRRSGPRPRTGAPNFQLLYPDEMPLGRQDRDDRHARSTAPTASSSCRPPRKSLKQFEDLGLRPPADLHGQDPVLAQPRRGAEGPPDRLHGPDPRGPPVGRAPGSSRRCAARCGRCRGCRRDRAARRSTSTPTGTSSGCSSAARSQPASAEARRSPSAKQKRDDEHRAAIPSTPAPQAATSIGPSGSSPWAWSSWPWSSPWSSVGDARRRRRGRACRGRAWSRCVIGRHSRRPLAATSRPVDSRT